MYKIELKMTDKQETITTEERIRYEQNKKTNNENETIG